MKKIGTYAWFFLALIFPVTSYGLTVTNIADSGPGSLRQAIVDTAAGGTVDFQAGLSGTITLASELVIDKDLSVQGPGADLLTLSGGNATRILNINGGTQVVLSDLRFANGFVNGDGAAILLSGPNIELNRCIFEFNAVECDGDDCDAAGAALANGSGGIDIQINQCQFAFNTANCSGVDCDSSGGVIDNGGGSITMVVNDSTFDSNQSNCVGDGCDAGGAVIDNGGGGVPGDELQITLTNDTFFSNTSSCSGVDCDAEGGALSNGGGSVIIEVNFTTFSSNLASCVGTGCSQSGTSIDAGGADFRPNSSIFHSTSPGTICDASVNSLGYNIDSDGSCAVGGPEDKPLTDPGLDPEGLKDNGGPTETIALQDISPAIDSGNPSCPPPDTDQRGIPRPIDGSGDGVARCDAGAYELVLTDLALSKVSNVSEVQGGSTVIYTLTARNNGPTLAPGVVLTDTLPPELSFVSAPDFCLEAAGTVTCDLGDLDSGEEISVPLTVTVDEDPAGTSITNTATVTFAGEDSNPNDNTASATVLVEDSGAVALSGGGCQFNPLTPSKARAWMGGFALIAAYFLLKRSRSFKMFHKEERL